MYCTSLKQRPAFAPALPIIALSSRLALRESALQTHDLAVPLHGGQSARLLRLLLFSAGDVADSKRTETIERVAHLISRYERQEIAIVFLLAPMAPMGFLPARQLPIHEMDRDQDNSEGVLAFTRLQAEFLGQQDLSLLTVLPLAKLDGLSDLVKQHIRALALREARASVQTPPRAFDLLRQCSAAPPMPEQTAFFLSDLFPSLRHLAIACSSVTSVPESSSPYARTYDAGIAAVEAPGDDLFHSSQSKAQTKLKQLRDLAGILECQNVIEFWRDEWTV